MSSINFKGKDAVWNHHLGVPYQILEKDKTLSLKGKNEDENLIIEADNLSALKSLLPKYQSSIKCIYIDPPYNIGNENWIYNDKVNSTLIRDWIGKTVGVDDLTRHDKWLCMMTPRLKLLRELLTDNGIIYISIDDHEEHNLKNLLNEIFGENNFIALLPVITNLKGNQDSFGFAETHEYVYVYAKSKENCKIGQFNIEDEEFGDWLEDEYGLYKIADNLRATGVNAPRSKRPNLWYPIFVDEEKQEIYVTDNNKPISAKHKVIWPINKAKEELSWYWSKPTFRNKKYNLIIKITSNGYQFYRKQRPFLGDLPTKKPKSFFYKPEYSTSTATNQLKDLMGKKVFEGPKPVPLISDLIEIGTSKGKDDIVLDSFAGSGTTAQAIMEINQRDGGNRKFILIQLQEEIKKKSEAYLAGFRWVHEITRERTKRVIERDKLGIGFTYMKLGTQIDADSILSGDLPTYKEFAKYVYYLATGMTMDDEKSINEKEFFVGKINSESIYLLYKKDKEKLKKLAITLDWAENINNKDSSKKIVYAPACFLDEEYLEKFNINFVSIPYNLFGKK